MVNDAMDHPALLDQIQFEPPVDIGVAVQITPEILLLSIVTVLVIVILSWAILRWFRRTPAQKLKRVLSGYDSASILMHPNPDPDSMASAIGIARIADWVGVETSIHYTGQIRHQENRAFRTVLDLEMEKIEHYRELMGDVLILVDHNVPRGFAGAKELNPDIVIDHHIGNGSGTEFTDVRSEYGSSATIVAEYFRDLKSVILGPDERIPEGEENLFLPSAIATGLIYGIQSDTSHLTKGCHNADFQMASYLFNGIDTDRLDRIANPAVTAEVLDIKSEAIANREVDGSFAISYVGELSDADAIPQAADELSKLEGITAVVVMGQRNGTLHLSGRSRDDRVHMGKALETAVNHIPMASAGGHARMGGGQIEIEHMEGLGPSGGTSVTELQDRLFRCMNGDV